MYGKDVEYAGYKVFVWCTPQSSEEKLQEYAKAKFDRALKLKLRDPWFKMYLTSSFSEEHILADQAKYVS